MEENKNQTISAAPDDIVVKDLDGNFKVLSDGELKDLDDLLSSTQSAATIPQISSVNPPHGGALDFPKFTDLAAVPVNEHFEDPAVAKKGTTIAEHQFHPDDQDEVERELEKLNTVFGLSQQKQYSIVKIAQKLVDKHGLKLSEKDFMTFQKIVLSYFRQARSSVETRAMFTMTVESGGVGINSDTADHMIAVLKHLKLKIEETDGIVVEVDDAMPSMAQPAPAPQNMPEPKPRPMPQPEMKPAMAPIQTATPPAQPLKTVAPIAAAPIQEKKPEPIMPPATPMSPPQPTPAGMPEVKPAQNPAPAIQPIPEAPQPAVVAEEMPKMNRPQIPSFKPPIVEIKRPQSNAVRSGKPTGRVEELALMDLATWRMLDPDPRIRAGKILGKIQNLEQESLTRKSQGIQAWRSNEVYQYYLMIGQMSLEHKKEVAEIIQSMMQEGQQTLTLDEFEAVSDLNRMLRY